MGNMFGIVVSAIASEINRSVSDRGTTGIVVSAFEQHHGFLQFVEACSAPPLCFTCSELNL